ncbi:hypothetical protein PG993_004049 [Apiospora rasikravindrae]|uniref:Uncharacterized protein n=1 Tax=Apiospora rasikravindrae TaxID=990691 RepID=A0ABR1TBP2_9PEZI
MAASKVKKKSRYCVCYPQKCCAGQGRISGMERWTKKVDEQDDTFTYGLVYELGISSKQLAKSG